MGEYFHLVNETKKEYARSPSLMKLWEWAVNFDHRLFTGALLKEKWNCDRIALVGDYNEERVTWDDLESWKEIFPRLGHETVDKREERLRSFCKETGFTHVYFCLDRNEYICTDEVDGDVTNVLGILLYLIAFSYKAGEKVPEGILSRWAFCRIEARESIPKGATSISRQALEYLKTEDAFRAEGDFESWKSYYGW